MSYTTTAKVKCPYFIRENENSISCEGHNSDVCVLKFRSRRKKSEHEKKYCYRYENKCALAVANDKKYQA